MWPLHSEYELRNPGLTAYHQPRMAPGQLWKVETNLQGRDCGCGVTHGHAQYAQVFNTYLVHALKKNRHCRATSAETAHQRHADDKFLLQRNGEVGFFQGASRESGVGEQVQRILIVHVQEHQLTQQSGDGAPRRGQVAAGYDGGLVIHYLS